MSDVVCVLASGALLGEGALWDAGDQRLHWVDLNGRPYPGVRRLPEARFRG